MIEEQKAQDAIGQYVEAGSRFIPLKGKLPIEAGYHRKRYDVAKLNGHNVGLMIENGLVDLDLDWPESRLLARLFLPKTDAFFGTKTVVAHGLYRCETSPKDYRLPKVAGAPALDGDHGSMILQLRTSTDGKPYHVMCPPSVHPNTKERLVWWWGKGQTSHLPSSVEPDELHKKVGLLAAACFFVRFYPEEGSRDEFALCMAGALLRADWNDETVNDFIRRVAQEAGDNQVEMRASKAKRTRQRLEDDRTVYGLPRMAKILGVPIEWVYEVATWIGARKSADAPAVFISSELPKTTRQAWCALSEYTIKDDPAVYLYGTELARINGNGVERLDNARLRHELARAATWMAPKEKEENKWKPTKPPQDVVSDMMAARLEDRTLPLLAGVTTVPIFTREGKLIKQPGYDYETGVFYRPTCDVDVPDNPSLEEISKARETLSLLLQDFPFVDKSDEAHAFALMFEHVAREMWAGPSPMYLFNKPSPGTGASLLVSSLSIIPRGRPASEKSEPTSDTEWEKVITTMLMEGEAFMFFDNVEALRSPTLAMALTALRYKGRILGSSQTVEVPVRCSWVATGNNPDLPGEMYRRMIDVRLDAGVEHPEDRPLSSFKIPNLRRWVDDNRERLVSAVLTIVQGWVRAGMPAGERSKASYEDWARVLGGIVAFAGVDGFLKTPADRRPTDSQMEEMRRLVIRWLKYACHPQDRDGGLADIDYAKPLKAQELVKTVEVLGLPFEFRHSEKTRVMGDKLKHYRDRVFEIETTGGKMSVTLRGAPRNNSMRWSLEYEGTVDPEPPCPF